MVGEQTLVKMTKHHELLKHQAAKTGKGEGHDENGFWHMLIVKIRAHQKTKDIKS
jgi:hypothetical protein